MVSRIVLVATLAPALAAAACKDRPRESPPSTSDASASASPHDGGGGSFGTRPQLLDASMFVIEDGGTLVAQPPDARSDDSVPDPEPPVDPSKLIADLNAIPAWQAVVDRAQLLGRREQHGVVYGRIGPVVMVPAPVAPATGSGAGSGSGSAAPPVMIASPYVWLADDTEGSGALGIRVALGGRKAAEGARVALGGAWHLDDDRRWYWKVDVVQALPAAPATDKDPVAPVPGQQIVNGELPWGTKGITFAKDGEPAYFTLVGRPPANDGEGWPVANELGDVVYGLMTLPGERPSFGAQDMRSPDERWQLKAGQVYWARIAKVRKREGKPALITVKMAPIRVK